MYTKVENIMNINGISLADIAEKYGTPLYVYSQNLIEEKCQELKKMFVDKYENVRVAYAAKAFMSIYMCKIIEKQGFCIDVVSGGEIFVALKAGFPPERIEFNGNNKTYEELSMAIENNIGRIIVDNLQEIDIIEKLCKHLEKRVNVLFRISPGVKISTHDYIATGKKDSKFGIPLDENVIFPYVERAISSEYINFLGFHFHIGSQLFQNKPYIVALEVLLKLVSEVKDRFDFDIKELNIGGGFGIKYVEEDSPKPYSYFVDAIMKRLEEFYKDKKIIRPTVVVEPGRSIVGEAGLTLYKVGSIKEIIGIRRYVAVDGGMTDNIRPALYQAKYDCAVVNKCENSSEKYIYTICGKCCESGDILIKDVELPKIEIGDTIAIFSTGAYCYSMASNYNKNLIPAVLFLDGNKEILAIRRQSYEQLIINDL